MRCIIDKMRYETKIVRKGKERNMDKEVEEPMVQR